MSGTSTAAQIERVTATSASIESAAPTCPEGECKPGWPGLPFQALTQVVPALGTVNATSLLIADVVPHRLFPATR